MATVMVSPVRSASLRASRSVFGSLMVSAMRGGLPWFLMINILPCYHDGVWLWPTAIGETAVEGTLPVRRAADELIGAVGPAGFGCSPWEWATLLIALQR